MIFSKILLLTTFKQISNGILQIDFTQRYYILNFLYFILAQQLTNATFFVLIDQKIRNSNTYK